MSHPAENPDIAAAFEAFVAMGMTRSLHRLWKNWDKLVKTGRPRPTYRAICKWAEQYHWKERAAERDKKFSQKLAEKNDALRLQSAEHILEILYARIRTIFDEEGNITLPIQSYQDLNDTIRLALHIMGCYDLSHRASRPSKNQTSIKIIKVIENLPNQNSSTETSIVDAEVREVPPEKPSSPKARNKEASQSARRPNAESPP